MRGLEGQAWPVGWTADIGRAQRPGSWKRSGNPKQTLIKSNHTMAHSLDISWNRDSAEGGATIDVWLDPE